MRWENWGPAAFQRAKNEGKLVFLSISAVWCHWCHVLDRTTLSHPEVQEVLVERFVAVRVDGDAQPDVEAAYLMGGWPTVAVLTPEGEPLAGATYLTPDWLLTMLRQAEERHLKGERLSQPTAVSPEAATRPAGRIGAVDLSLVDEILAELHAAFDHEEGGFGTTPKFPLPEAVTLLLERSVGHPASPYQLMARKTLEAHMRLSDPVWGGFFRYATDRGWQQPHYEKMLAQNAMLVDNYLDGFRLFEEPAYRKMAEKTVHYLRRFLSHRHAGFYASQDADLHSHEADAEVIDGREYHSKGETERLRLGLPFTDERIFSGQNGLAVSAYLKAFNLLGGDPLRDFALRTVDELLQESVDGEGAVSHIQHDPQSLRGLLGDQAHFGQALVAAFATTGETRYLSAAEQVTEYVLRNLADENAGAFRLRRPLAQDPLGSHIGKPLDENAAFARLLCDLHLVTGKSQYEEVAHRCLAELRTAARQRSYLAAGYALAVQRLVRPSPVIAVVGFWSLDATRSLYFSACALQLPRPLVVKLDPEQAPPRLGEAAFPTREEPGAYLCISDRCLGPFESPAALQAAAREERWR